MRRAITVTFSTENNENPYDAHTSKMPYYGIVKVAEPIKNNYFIHDNIFIQKSINTN